MKFNASTIFMIVLAAVAGVFLVFVGIPAIKELVLGHYVYAPSWYTGPEKGMWSKGNTVRPDAKPPTTYQSGYNIGSGITGNGNRSPSGGKR